MQGLVLQLTRVGFLLAAMAVHLVGAADPAYRHLRADRCSDGATGTGAAGLAAAQPAAPQCGPPSGRHRRARWPAPASPWAAQPVLIGRADDSTLVLTDDYASTRHARLSPRGSEWYVEDLGSTNGTYLDRAKVTTAVRVPMGTPVRIGKTVIELRP